MKYLRLFVITLVISSMLVSCASFNYSETVDAVNKAAENGADINTLEELAEQYGLPPLETLEDAAESDSETQTPTVYTDAEVDIDDAEQWTELEVPPAEEESKSMEEAAVQPENGSDENQTEPTEQTKQTEETEETSMFPRSTMDMNALAPVHMDAVEPTLPGATWSSAADLVIPEPATSPDEEASEDVQPETPVAPAEDLPTITWEEAVPQEQISTTTFIEGTSVAPEWDMLSEYDRFLAEMGEDVKIAESVDTTSFVVSEPVPIDTVPPAPVFVDPSQIIEDAPQTIAAVNDEDIQWETVETVETEQPDTTIAPETLSTSDEPVYYGPTQTEVEGMMNVESEEPSEPQNGFMDGFMALLARVWQAVSSFFIKIWMWFKNLLGLGATTV